MVMTISQRTFSLSGITDSGTNTRKANPISEIGLAAGYQPDRMTCEEKPGLRLFWPTQPQKSICSAGSCRVPRYGHEYLPSVRPLMYGVLDIQRLCPALIVLGAQSLWITNSGLIGLRHLKELAQLTVYELGSILLFKSMPSVMGVLGVPLSRLSSTCYTV